MVGVLSRVRNRAREHLLRVRFPRGKFHLKKYGRIRPDAALVVVCLWNRHTRFRELLEDFAAQDFDGGVVLAFWNNDLAHRRHYEREIAWWLAERTSSGISAILITHSPVNTGGFGRFYLGRRLIDEIKREYLIFLDDDQRISSDFVRRTIEQAAPRTIASWWAWQISNDDYWDRVRALPGQHADYAGTGGMLLDADLLRDSQLVSGLDSSNWFLEDIWLSHLATIRGFRLIGLDAEIEFVMDETNQFHTIAPLKPAYYRSLAITRRAQ